jgi:hypothetical protein
LVLTNALGLINQDRWKDFLSFIQTGEASDDFMSFLDSDENAQKAVELVVQYQSNALRRHSRAVHASTGERLRPSQIADVIGATMELPDAERAEVLREAVRDAVATLRESIPPERESSLQSAVRDVGRELVGTGR